MSMTICNSIAKEHDERRMAAYAQLGALDPRSKEGSELRFKIWQAFRDEPENAAYFSCGEGIAVWLMESLDMKIPQVGLRGDEKETLQRRIAACISLSVEPADRMLDAFISTGLEMTHCGQPDVLPKLLEFLQANEVVYLS